jgi:hypothetical protein
LKATRFESHDAFSLLFLKKVRRETTPQSK